MNALARLARKPLFTDRRGVRGMARPDLVFLVAEAHIAEARLAVGTSRVYGHARERWDGLRTTDLDEVHTRAGGRSGSSGWGRPVASPIQFVRDLRGIQRVLDRELFRDLEAVNDLSDCELRSVVSRVVAYDGEMWVAFRRFHAVAGDLLRRMVRADQQRRRRRTRTQTSFREIAREVAAASGVA